MNFPLIISPDTSTPLYMRLASSMKEAIDSGRITQGQAMPSSRDLSQSLGISRDTIVRSYSELVRAGLIYTRSGGGTFVRCNACSGIAMESPGNGRCCSAFDSSENNEFAGPKLQAQTDFSPAAADPSRLQAISQFARDRLRVRDLNACAGDHASINYGATPPELLPLKQWKELMSRNLVNRAPEQIDYAPEIFGHRPLREQMALFLRRTQAIIASPDQLAVFNDSQNAVNILAQLLIDPGDVVAVENPGYGTVREVFRSYGAEVVEIPVDEEGIRVDVLAQDERHFKLVYVTPAHQDPLGIKMSLARRRELLDWSRDNCHFIVEDGFDSDFNFGSAPLPSLLSMSDSENVIFIYSFWKTLYPLISTGCLIMPPFLIEALTRLKRHTDRSSSIVERYTLTDFLAEGHLERHLSRIKPLLRGRRNTLLFELSRAFQGRMQCLKEGAGLHLALRLNVDKSSREIAAAAAESGFPLISSRNYYASNPVPNEFLVSFARVSEEEAPELVRRFAEKIL